MKEKKYDTTPFDRRRRPVKQNMLAMPFLWAYCYYKTKMAGLKINKVHMGGVKPPFLLLATHHSFADFYVTPLTIFPFRANYISELEGFEAFGEWAYRQVGCLGTRKFVNDIVLIGNIKHVVDNKGIIVIYPEARYCNVGTHSKLAPSVGKLAKLLKVPVVTLNMRGNYLQSPIWNLAIRKEARLEATITKVFSAEDVQNLTASKLTDGLQQYLAYDEYRWQKDTQLAIHYTKRAEGLHLPLYQCCACKAEYAMQTTGNELFCTNCKKRWVMDEYGQLHATVGETTHAHIPDWYNAQRADVESEIDAGRYHLDIKVQVESLPNAKNFIPLGKGRLTHSHEGFVFSFTEYGKEKKLTFAPQTMLSIHTEYNYRGKGQCFVLSTLDNSYFIYPLDKNFNVTKVQFATEYLYQKTDRRFSAF